MAPTLASGNDPAVIVPSRAKLLNDGSSKVTSKQEMPKAWTTPGTWPPASDVAVPEAIIEGLDVPPSRSGQASFDFTFDVTILGDLNGDEIVGASDLLILLANWGRCADCDNCNADIDGNCTVGAADLLILLSNWG